MMVADAFSAVLGWGPFGITLLSPEAPFRITRSVQEDCWRGFSGTLFPR